MNIQILSIGIVMGILLIYFVILTVAIVMLWKNEQRNKKSIDSLTSHHKDDMNTLQSYIETIHLKIEKYKTIQDQDREKDNATQQGDHKDIISYIDSRVEKIDAHARAIITNQRERNAELKSYIDHRVDKLNLPEIQAQLKKVFKKYERDEQKWIYQDLMNADNTKHLKPSKHDS